MSALYETVRTIVSDPRSAALVTESCLTPTNGAAKPIAPPTYANQDRSKEPRFAYTQGAFVPEADEEGWYCRIRRDQLGNPVKAPQVIVNSTPAETGRSEEALWFSQRRLGLQLPGIAVVAPSSDVVDGAIESAIKKVKVVGETAQRIRAEAREVFHDFGVSTWTTAHRQSDAWIKYAADPGGEQIWQGGAIRDLITSASAEHADVLFANFPNAAVFGMWLSSGVARRHRIPRAYSSEIVGFEAEPIQRAATKLDIGGSAAKDTALTMTDGALREGRGHKPSDFGFGQIPTSPHDAAFVCGSILQQASISLPVFRSFRYSDDADDDKRTAAATVYTLLAVTGHELAAEDYFLRSECALVRESARWGRRRTSSNGSADIEEFEVADADTAAAALQVALETAADVGLRFADRIEVRLSPVQAAIVAERVAREASKTTGTDE